MLMPRYVALVFTNPLPGAEDRYNDWYYNVHLDEILAKGVVQKATRLSLAGGKPDENGNRYLTAYEFETDDLKSAGKALAGGPPKEGAPAISDLVDMEKLRIQYFEVRTERSAP
jgi:hypothetical protein